MGGSPEGGASLAVDKVKGMKGAAFPVDVDEVPPRAVTPPPRLAQAPASALSLSQEAP
jgi:hypothetical protein